MFKPVGGIMGTQQTVEAGRPVQAGPRKARPRACLADGKQHIRTFLAAPLEELGFITCECAQIGELPAILETQPLDLFVLGLSAGGVEGAAMLSILAANGYDGKVLLVGPRDWPVVAAVETVGQELGLAMLPMLPTPFAAGNLRDSVASLMSGGEPASPPIDVAQAVSAGRLELWYQPKLDTRTLGVASAEALVRLRHPSRGVVLPAGYFIDGDPYARALSRFVIGRAIQDWHDFLGQHGPVEIAINLPIDFLRDPESVLTLCAQMPKHPAFQGLIVEIDSAEILRNLPLMKEIAKQVRFHNIGLSIDHLGAEWLSFADIGAFPFVEIKVDRKFVAGCADNALKKMVCRQIRELADSVGARTVAEGVETRADFGCVREMGFDMVQGLLFGKPVPARKFTRGGPTSPVILPH
jgi:EAL domain-containing protein (putative c-di-GMP-specific phosphodiesterase class I)